MTEDNRKRTIVGIDPGSTSAIAVLDMRGKPKAVMSKKHMGQDEIVKAISDEGKPVLVTTDKEKLPSTVESISTDFSAEVFLPEDDLSIDKKRKLTEEHDYRNLHERDALAAAMNAYNSFKNKFKNIESRMDDLNLVDMSPRIKELVVKGEARNVSEAVEKALGNGEEEGEEEVKEEPSGNLDEKIDNYRNIIIKERKDRQKLKEHNRKLKKRIENLERRMAKIKEEKNDLEAGVKNEVFEARKIKKLERNLRSKKNRIRTLEQDKSSLRKNVEELRTFLEVIKEGMVPLREINPLNEAEIRKQDNRLSLKESVVLVHSFPKNVETVLKHLKSADVKAVVGDIDEEVSDRFVSEGIWTSEMDDLRIKERNGVKYIEGSEIDDMKRVKKDSFIGWMKRYRDRNG